MKKYQTILSTSMTVAVGMAAWQLLDMGQEKKAEASTTYTYKVNTSVLNVRDKASINGKKLGTVKQGDILSVSQTMGNGWLKIAYKGKTAYVCGDYVKKVAATTVKSEEKPATNKKYEYIVNTDVLNVRSESSINGRKLGTVKKGERLTVKQTLSNGWHRIDFKGKTGYVSGDYVKKKVIETTTTTPPVTTNTNYEIIKSDVNLRDKASWSGKSLAVIKKGQAVKAQVHNNDWMKVTYNGKTGYVAKEYVKITTTQKPNEEVRPPSNPDANVTPPVQVNYEYVVTTTTLNVRSGASTKHQIIGTVKNGEKLDVKESVMGWYKINYKGKTGYVSAGYVEKREVKSSTSEPTPEKPTPPNNQEVTHEIVQEDVNLRDQPSWSANKIIVIKKGTKVHAQSHNKDWMKVTYNGKTGYVAKEYVHAIDETNQSNTATSYKQVDLRKKSNVTASEINTYVEAYTNLTGKPSKIAGMGQYIIDIGKEYGINELFLAAIIIHESDYGTSYLAHFKNNLTGLYAFDAAPYDCAARFSSVNESIRYAASYIRASYLNENGSYYNGAFLGDKQGGMNVKYSSDALWGQKIANHMEKIKAFDKAYYDKQSISAINMNVSNMIPDNQDSYPVYARAVANTTISLYDQKGGKKVGTLNKGDIFTPIAKTNDHYLKIATSDGKVYWTSKLPMSKYKDSFQFTNVLRVRNDKLGTVALYADPAKNTVVEQVNNFSYLQLDKSKSTDKFYAVIYKDKTVWIEKGLAEVVYE
ncbi:MAG: SH3 domain-containing protein [Bacillaceae bacterium]